MLPSLLSARRDNALMRLIAIHSPPFLKVPMETLPRKSSLLPPFPALVDAPTLPQLQPHCPIQSPSLTQYSSESTPTSEPPERRTTVMSSSYVSYRRERGDKHQQQMVDDLVRKYYKSRQPSPVLRDLLQGPVESDLLIKSLRRQVSLIKCRSPCFEDSQITVYDRALMVMSDYGNDPADVGALELYLTEFLGVVPIGSAADGKDIVAKHNELLKILPKGMIFYPSQPCLGFD